MPEAMGTKTGSHPGNKIVGKHVEDIETILSKIKKHLSTSEKTKKKPSVKEEGVQKKKIKKI